MVRRWPIRYGRDRRIPFSFSREIPRPGAGEVLIQIEAVGGTLPGLFHLADTELPARPGAEISGIISAVGDEVSGFEVGQAVAGLTMVGTMAEYTVAPAFLLDVVPEGGAATAMAPVKLS